MVIHVFCCEKELPVLSDTLNRGLAETIIAMGKKVNLFLLTTITKLIEHPPLLIRISCSM